MSAKSQITPRLSELAEKAELARISYIDLTGFPRVVPVWFASIGGELYAATYASSKKWKAIIRDPRLGWVIDAGADHKYWGVSAYGRVEQVTDPELRARIYSELGVKYFGSPEHEKFVEIYGEMNDAETVYFRLKQEGASTWEY
jgi:nitroimidazol reductase NimA-like FMN-containing flavoprotein (pyridoxamine 5'-phosphate oxidase superfamily)